MFCLYIHSNSCDFNPAPRFLSCRNRINIAWHEEHTWSGVFKHISSLNLKGINYLEVLLVFFFPESFSAVRTCVNVYVCFFLSLCRREVYSTPNIYKMLLLLALWKGKISQKRLGRKEWKGILVSGLGNCKALLSCGRKRNNFVYISKS